MQNHANNRLEIIDIYQLKFDPQNPRIPSHVNGNDEQEILLWMLEDAGIFDLMESIAEQGYFNGEPLLVAKSSQNEFIVVEGNRRLASLKLLQNPSLVDIRQKRLISITESAKHKPTQVPCIVYEDRESILDYLGFRHVTGIKSWSPLAKARYLAELSNKYSTVDEEGRYQQLAKTIGSRTDYVKRMLSGLKLYDIIDANDFYDIDNLNEDTISFSLVTTALANTNIVDFLGLENAQDLEQSNLNYKHLEELTHWVFEEIDGRTRLGESRNFRDLNKVVASADALLQFRNGRSLNEALIYTDAPADTFRILLLEAKKNLQESQNQLYLIREGLSKDDLSILEDIEILVEDITSALRGRIKRSSRRSDDFDIE